MEKRENSDIPSFSDWQKENKNATLNDYYKIFGQRIPEQTSTPIVTEANSSNGRKRIKLFNWFLVIVLVLIPILTVVLLPNSRFSLFIKNSIGLSTANVHGKYIRVENNDKGNSLLGWKVKGLVKEIEFNGNHCTFDYVGIKVSGSFEIDGTKIYIAAGGELGTLSMEIVNGNRLEGEGWIDGTFVKQ